MNKDEKSGENICIEHDFPVLTCTFVKTVLLNDELEVSFRVQSSEGSQSLHSLLHPDKLYVAFESMSIPGRTCACPNCGTKSNSPSKDLVFRYSENSLCNGCGIKALNTLQNLISVSSDKTTGSQNSGCEIIPVKDKIDVSDVNYQLRSQNAKTNQVDKTVIVESNNDNSSDSHSDLSPKKTVDNSLSNTVEINIKKDPNEDELDHVDVPNYSSTDDTDTGSKNDQDIKFIPKKKKRIINPTDKPSCNICNICGKQLRTIKTLKNHILTHDVTGQYKCDICHHTFTHYRYLKKHEKTHIIGKPYSCEICGQTFKLKASIPKHMPLHNAITPYKCLVCQKQFHSKLQLGKHSYIHSDSRGFLCTVCGKSFRTKGAMKSHTQTHEGPLKHACDQCDKRYRSLWYLQIHKKTHSGENLIQCHACGDWFIDPCYFKLHQKKYCKGRSVECDICKMEFPHNLALQSHKGVHTGERPHDCKICGRAFAKLSLLKEHSKRHQPDNFLSCHFCTKGFINTKELKRHEQCHLIKKKRATLPDKLKPGHIARTIDEQHLVKKIVTKNKRKANKAVNKRKANKIPVSVFANRSTTPTVKIKSVDCNLAESTVHVESQSAINVQSQPTVNVQSQSTVNIQSQSVVNVQTEASIGYDELDTDADKEVKEADCVHIDIQDRGTPYVLETDNVNCLSLLEGRQLELQTVNGSVKNITIVDEDKVQDISNVASQSN